MTFLTQIIKNSVFNISRLMYWLIALLSLPILILVLGRTKREKEKTLELQTSKKFCHCGKKLTKTGRSSVIQIYTRNGTINATQNELRYL